MKKILLLVLIASLFTTQIFADEYEDVYDLVVPNSFSFLIVEGGLTNVGGNASQLNYSDNLIEISLLNSSFNFNVQANPTYRYYNQRENDVLDIYVFGNAKVGTSQTGIYANGTSDYASYDLDVNGLPGFYSFGGDAIINALTSSLTFNLTPRVAIGVGRVYSIYNVYRAKLMMEELGVVPTPEKVEKVVSIFLKANQILNQYTDNITTLYKDYYQQLADAMDIGDRVDDVIILNLWNSQNYAFNRARFVDMINSWDARLAAEFKYQQNVGSAIFTLNSGPEARIGGFLTEDKLYYDANAQVKLNYIIGGAFSFYVNTNARIVYLPDDYRFWAEAIADIDYISNSLTPFQFDLAGAGYYLINPNFSVYAGLRFDETPGIYAFAGGRIRLW